MIQSIKLFIAKFKIYFFAGVLVGSVASSVYITRNYVINSYKAKESEQLKAANKEANRLAETLRLERANNSAIQTRMQNEIIQLKGVQLHEQERAKMDDQQKLICNKPLFDVVELRRAINRQINQM